MRSPGTRSFKSLARRQAAFEVAGVAGHAVGTKPVDDCDEEIEFEGTDLAVVHDLGGLGEIEVADDRRQRGIFKQDDELSDQCWDHVFQTLR